MLGTRSRAALPVLLSAALAGGGGLVSPRTNAIHVSHRNRKDRGDERESKCRYYAPHSEAVQVMVAQRKLSKKQKAKMKKQKKG